MDSDLGEEFAKIIDEYREQLKAAGKENKMDRTAGEIVEIKDSEKREVTYQTERLEEDLHQLGVTLELLYTKLVDVLEREPGDTKSRLTPELMKTPLGEFIFSLRRRVFDIDSMAHKIRENIRL